jgi:hypothetical protein
MQCVRPSGTGYDTHYAVVMQQKVKVSYAENPQKLHGELDTSGAKAFPIGCLALRVNYDSG